MGGDAVTLPDGSQAEWISEAGEAPPVRVLPVDDHLRAKTALRQMQAGEVLLWEGDYHNAFQLLRAVKKRLKRPKLVPEDLAARWQLERSQVSREAGVLSRLVIALEPDGSVALRRAPDTREAVRWAWGAAECRRVVSLRTLRGAMGAAGWRRAGLEVPGLEGVLVPHYGVFAPTRHAYVELLDELGDVSGADALDVGCGTGVLSFVLLQRGLARAVGTDVEPRAIACAVANAAALGVADRFEAVSADLFVEGRFDLVLFNAPWMPAVPATRLDRAVFDPEGALLERWLAGLSAHLRPGGQGALILSDLPERMGLRAEGALEDAFARAGLRVIAQGARPAGHGRARDRTDALHLARAGEQVRIFRLVPTDPGVS